MNRKIVIISFLIILIIIFSLILYFIYFDKNNDDVIENNGITIDDFELFIGKWNDLFYSLDDDSYSTWEFYENNSIKNLTSGLTYNGEKNTVINWHQFKLEDNILYLKFGQNDEYNTYSYNFTNLNNHLSIYELNDYLGIPIKSFNRITD